MTLEELQKVVLEDTTIYINAFKELMKKITFDEFRFMDEEHDEYFIINETRLDSQFVHIVPRELKELFDRLKEENPDDFLGFTVKIKKARLSCFGVPCQDLTNALIGR
jgi:hypothetical protein